MFITDRTRPKAENPLKFHAIITINKPRNEQTALAILKPQIAMTSLDSASVQQQQQNLPANDVRGENVNPSWVEPLGKGTAPASKDISTPSHKTETLHTVKSHGTRRQAKEKRPSKAKMKIKKKQFGKRAEQPRRPCWSWPCMQNEAEMYVMCILK